MTGTIETRLAELGITLPDAPAPAANYVPYVIVGDMVYVSGQVSADANGFITGKLGDDLLTAMLENQDDTADESEAWHSPPLI